MIIINIISKLPTIPKQKELLYPIRADLVLA